MRKIKIEKIKICDKIFNKNLILDSKEISISRPLNFNLIEIL